MANSKPSSQGYFSLTIEIAGNDLKKLHQEAGGLRLQRIPPTERSGRVHTSTVTVAVMDPEENFGNTIPESEIKVEWYSGSGPGGQKKNKVKSSCRLTHLPTGVVCTAQTRSRENSYRQAFDALKDRIHRLHLSTSSNARSVEKRQQVGTGQRGDKIRTIQFQRDKATDHRTGKKISAYEYMNGFMDRLW